MSHSYPNKDRKGSVYQKNTHMVSGSFQWILEARLEISGDRNEMTYNSGVQLDFNQEPCNYTVNVSKPTGHHDSLGSGSQIYSV